ncbi:unnamed protein product [Musa acuminata subsp. malaccensis]|uniref:(wild Malaysian banana) hypothetical protein n=1 Tax=Musa acuminata subsp. malaccensis TaxID=214687 RepID=A0A804IF50_MUSAM|nr:unnamed protein product [Musa acuminata subsp. malaccensis]
MDLEGRSGNAHRDNAVILKMNTFHRTGILQASAPGWNGTAGVNTSPITKKVIRLDIPVDKYLNACGNFLTLILFLQKQYNYLSINYSIFAEFTADIVDLCLNQAVTILDLVKPMVESMDYYKNQQLRELAILNGTLREKTLI